MKNYPTQNIKCLILILCTLIMDARVRVVEGLWCVARSGASDDVLQSGLDYACATSADCIPLQQTGLCFLPNTLQAHASYAFNSFFQMNNMIPGSCDFSGSATLAKTDPSYGACVYPASPSTAGSITSPTTSTTPTTNPYGTSPFGSSSPLTPSTTGTIDGGSSGASPNYMGPPIATTSNSTITFQRLSVLKTLLIEMLILLVTSSLALF